MHKNRTLGGFTLIEMSIVLVIIGLIVGGIFLGQSLIRQSEINSAMSDEQKYISAVANFQQKYGSLPGDFASATSYWAAATTCPPTYASPATATTTCDGDGNGQVGTSGTSTSDNAPSEEFLFWQHLDLAQMIPGAYNGTPGSAGTSDHVIGQNCPATKIDGTGFSAYWVGTITSSTNYYYPNNFGHVFVLGGYKSNAALGGNTLTSAESFAIDVRYDDGYPGTGNIQSWQAGSYTCTTSATPPSSYNSSATGYQCSLILLTGF